ncbi:transposable element Tcb2 transposase [Trichonephila clavipes]|nr:transposable element Tcb2 transposase [Trichonephila clavipes]
MHLAEANLKSKCPFRALPLTPEHRQLRLQWCQARSMWNVTDWPKLCLVMNPGLFWGQMIIVYGCGGALLVHFNCDAWNLNGQRYVDDILRPHVGPFLNDLPGAILQQDNARPHTARVPQDISCVIFRRFHGDFNF